MSTLGALSGSLAHELNQPLTAILSNAQAAQRFLAGFLLDQRGIPDAQVKRMGLVADNFGADELDKLPGQLAGLVQGWGLPPLAVVVPLLLLLRRRPSST